MKNALLFRQRLLQPLQAALANHHLIITAPAGYGKTILLQQLVAYRPDSYYLALTASDSDTAVLQARLQPLQQPGHTLLVDDVHYLAGEETAVAWLSQQVTHANCRYLLAGRFLPADLEHLLTKGEAVRWDETALLFAPAESQALLAGKTDQDEAWTDWHQQLEGWPLGLALLARLPGVGHTQKMARQQLFTYLAHELFDHLPDELYQFLRVTAVPLTFNDPLAAHLLDNDDAASLRHEIQRRNLFLYQDERPGWFRYHDLIRDYLLTQNKEALETLWQKTIAWFEVQDDLPQAIEHALAAAWPDEAARLINLVSPDYIYESDRYLTYKRWGEALDNQTRRQFPQILYNLGDFLFFLEDHAEIARRYMREALAAAQAQGDRRLTLMARWRLIFFELDENEATEADLNELAELSAEPEVTLYASQTYAMVLADQGRFAQAAVILQRAIKLAEEQQEWERVWRIRAFRALIALLPLGRFAQAAEQFAGTLQYFANEPGRQYVTLQNRNELYFASANWSALTANLAEIDALERQLEIPAVYNLTWISYYRGLRAVGLGEFAAAAEHLAAMAGSFNAGDRRCEIPLTRAHCWLLRRQGKLSEAVALAEAELGREPPVFPHYRALLALERDIAAGMCFLDGERPDFALRSETISLIGMRARPDLVRLRALLALICHRQGNFCWRRHFQATCYALNLPYHERLLTDRDPELGGRFWQLALIEGLALEQAGAALQRLNQPEQLYPLLAHEETAVRQRAAQVLRQMGQETAMPYLSQAVNREKDKGTKRVLTAVLTHLETVPPPPMQVQLLGDFRLVRDGRPIPDSDWPRPVTRRLAQYFALHRGVALPRDQILDDLWPDLPPDKGWSNFRTVYSQLRRVVEPYMRPKVESRYFSLEGERYLFDPGGYVTVDAVEFETAVRGAIAVADQPLPALPDDLLTQLENYRPLLTELAYEEWLIAPRERLETTYLEGCLYVARGQLSYGRPAEAVVWARRAIARAPWLEEGYRTLMRAYARQDQRSLALKTYEEAVHALQDELNAAPSAMTQWLLTRLQRGEAI
jgi:DNA-binding SARP family transcriptional activator